ncbi:CLUMA_CG017019, isoform A [Clunio marinus]|uniref:CLUMA_CG017019, isoform A n=1 Tax=Clunio marinus TaxID=568069 RepID=A0A1J1IZ80_9DIPT|nr:CLUMA_CG017019, isoform A [Clunio marinus]
MPSDIFMSFQRYFLYDDKKIFSVIVTECKKDLTILTKGKIVVNSPLLYSRSSHPLGCFLDKRFI